MIYLRNETLGVGIIELAEKILLRVVIAKIGFKVAFRNEARVGINPGLPGYFPDGSEVSLQPRSNHDTHGYRVSSNSMSEMKYRKDGILEYW